MVTVEQARQFTLSLPGVEEYDHVGRPAFRANGRTFATMWVTDRRMNVILTQIDQSVFCAFDPKIVYPVPNKWGSHHGATLFELDHVREDMLQDAITTGWQTVMDKKPNRKSPKKS
ncbi:MmcQ/YjbR family DNA-binding protein [Mucilaginibacter sp. dw_454]|uniref:MmcQ/YjbR family DNA-binding protein n=1 Tax=Mucilaginibacter sp. dw_454 TaxID=2720079 RepID=UPI001BD69D2E|nr:MmcQ/YjbR family DNA-binding protein [Mucilaginibacter sp. dw_454]